MNLKINHTIIIRVIFTFYGDQQSCNDQLRLWTCIFWLLAGFQASLVEDPCNTISFGHDGCVAQGVTESEKEACDATGARSGFGHNDKRHTEGQEYALNETDD